MQLRAATSKVTPRSATSPGICEIVSPAEAMGREMAVALNDARARGLTMEDINRESLERMKSFRRTHS